MKKLQFFLMLMMACTILSAQSVEKLYHFDNPSITAVGDYALISFDGCMQMAEPGCPSLPWCSVSLMLPAGTEASSVEIEFLDYEEVEGEYTLLPKQSDIPYSKADEFVFYKNEACYMSKADYPSSRQGRLSTQYKNGYGFAFSSFTPVRYIPSTGKITYATTVKVTVHAEASRKDCLSMLKNTVPVVSSVRRLAHNPEMLESYDNAKAGVRQVPEYDNLVITSSQFVEGFSEYVAYYNSIGYLTRVATVEDIYASMSASDDAEKVRNYVIQEYQNSGISTLILGGDVSVVPYRGLYCYVSDQYVDEGIPADLYFAGLDGSWNDNDNYLWGEVGEDDLLPEIGVARLPFQTQTEQTNMIHKTLSYQQSPVLGEFTRVNLGGEWMSDTGPTYGSQYMNMVIGYHDEYGYVTTGIPEDYDFHTVYEEDGQVIGSGLMAAVNEGGQFTHHAGHAGWDYVAGWYCSDITDNNFSHVDGVEHNYTFFYSHGCIAGAFDENDCIMEEMALIQNFCVAAIGNSRYGWFAPGTNNGPSAHLHREFVDAQYTEKMPNLALALTEAKTQTAPWVNIINGENSSLRWNFYDLNILGDGATLPWLNEPFTPYINKEDVIMAGSQNTLVTVTDENGQPLQNFKCGLYDDTTCLGFAFTNEEGIADIRFDNNLSVIGQMKLLVSGQNAWPQSVDVQTQLYDTPYVIFEDCSLQNMEYDRDYDFDVAVKNFGNVTASDVSASLSCTLPQYVTITEGQTVIPSVASLETYSDAHFSISVSDNIPDGMVVPFTLTCSDGDNTWTSEFEIKASAPAFDITQIVISDDENNNHSIDPGETASVKFIVKNIGGSDSKEVRFFVENLHPEVTIDKEESSVETIPFGETAEFDFIVSLSEDVEQDVVYQLNIMAQQGDYVCEDVFGISIGHSMEGFETGDFSSYDWRFEGNAPWMVTTESPYQGDYCVVSSPIGDNENASLVLDVVMFKDDSVSFFRKVSSESGFDKLFFYIDDELQGEWSGNKDWAQYTFPVSYGSHALKWMYAKDGNTVGGSDCAWLDNITLPPTTIILDVRTNDEESFTLYPNPNNGTFSIEMPEENNQVIIFDLTGKVLYQNDEAPSFLNIRLDNVSPGMYLLKTNNTTRKIIIK